jgi:hypothetical protein
MATNGRGRGIVRDGPWGFAFLVAYIGAAVYFISSSDGSFLQVIFGLLKAIVWPAFIVFHSLQGLGA